MRPACEACLPSPDSCPLLLQGAFGKDQKRGAEWKPHVSTSAADEGCFVRAVLPGLRDNLEKHLAAWNDPGSHDLNWN